MESHQRIPEGQGVREPGSQGRIRMYKSIQLIHGVHTCMSSDLHVLCDGGGLGLTMGVT